MKQEQLGFRDKNATTLTPVTLKADNYLYDHIKQKDAVSVCQSMYTNNLFKSDLVNSYAWDTAIIFFQEFGGASDYASKISVNGKDNFSYQGTTSSSEMYTGTPDKICNVYDMASNAVEWTTEMSDDVRCALRGGCSLDEENYGQTLCASDRIESSVEFTDVSLSFRPILYM